MTTTDNQVDTDPQRVIAAIRRTRQRNTVRKALPMLAGSGMMPPAIQDYEGAQELGGYRTNAALPRDPREFIAGTFTPLTPIAPVSINIPITDDDDDERPAPRQREMPPGWNMPVGLPGTEGFKLASFQTLRTYADVYSVARACIQVRKGEIRGMEWDIMPTQEAEKRMRGDRAAHREFAERKKIVVGFFRKPDPDYDFFSSYIDALMEEMLVTDALSLYLHPTRKKGKGPFGRGLAALELISGSTIRPLASTRGGRVAPPSPGYQQYLYGVPRVDLMDILTNADNDEISQLGKPVKEYRGDQLMYLPYTRRSWTPYGFPPLERTLVPTITGLRKQQYQLNYFDEGTIPGNFISPGENLGWTPNQLQIWQEQQNAVAGDPAWKHKSIALPPGSKVFPMRPAALADQFDEIVMAQVCMGYDVMPMEMGITPRVSTTQTTGAANQMAKATEKTNERKSLKPTLSYFTDIFNVIIQQVWLQDDMRFVFEGLEEDEDENSLVERLVQMLQYGLASVDECRIALGKPPWGLPITSDPVYINPTAGMVPMGSIDPTTGRPMGTPPPAPVGAGLPPGAGPPGAAPGAVPGARPPAAIPGAPPKAPAPGSAGKPSGPAGSQAAGKPAAGPDGALAPPPPQNPRDGIAPDDKVGQARQDAAEAHAGLQADLHQQFAQGTPLEPPVRPPINAETEGETLPGPGKTKAMLSELDALRRQCNKGRKPSTWEARHLPGPIMDYFTALAKSLSPDDAAAITHEFIVACFGPPTLAAQLDSVRDGTFVVKDYADAYLTERRDFHGRWTRDDEGHFTAGNPGHDDDTEEEHRQHSYRGYQFVPRVTAHQEFEAEASRYEAEAQRAGGTKVLIAKANAQSQHYTDAQVKALNDKINQLQADLHKGEHSDAKRDMIFDLAGTLAAVVLIFMTGPAGLVALIPIMADKGPDIVKAIAGYLTTRARHTENILGAMKPGEKATDPAQVLIDYFTGALMKGGIPQELATAIATRTIQAARASLAAGRQPYDPGFLPPGTGELILGRTKNFTTSVPLGDPQQGLAPYDLNGVSTPIRDQTKCPCCDCTTDKCTCPTWCSTCTCATRADNGATVDSDMEVTKGVRFDPWAGYEGLAGVEVRPPAS